MSDNMRLFGAVNGAGIVNSHSQNVSFFASTPSDFHAPYTSVNRIAYSFTLFLHSFTIEHSLDSHERQANGMLVLPIFPYI